PHLETSGAGAAPARQPGRRDPGVLLGLSGDPRPARAAQPRRRGPPDRGLRAGASRKPRAALHAVLAGSDRTARYRVGQRQAGSVGLAAVKPVSVLLRRRRRALLRPALPLRRQLRPSVEPPVE